MQSQSHDKSAAATGSVAQRALRRKCECGQHTIAGAKCSSCQHQRPSLQRATRSLELETQNSEGVPIVHNVLGHDFSRVKVRTDGQLPVFRPARLDARLSAQTPAWSDNGEIYVGAAGLLIPPRERHQMLRHEMIHAFHQRLASVSNDSESQRHAEDLAVRGEYHTGGLALADFLKPAPVLLAYPPQTYSPWSKVWIGYAGLLGEVVEAGVTVRILLNYDDLGIKTSPNYQAYECAKHDLPPITEVVKKMKKAAQIAAEMNKQLPATATAQRVAMIIIFGDHTNSAYRSANGQGLIVLGRDEFDAGIFESTVTHESSHAIFEFHSVAGRADVSARLPDPLALRIANLYVQLSATKPVPEPKAKFDKKSPPPLTVKGGGDTHAAGIVMVTDTLWSGAGGHPWHGVDEFFASAYAGFLGQPALLGEIFKFYEGHDPAIKPLATELLSLLPTVDKPKKYGELKPPNNAQAATQTLGAVSAPVEFTKDHYAAAWFIDPSTMPSPDKINCSVKPVTDEDINKILGGDEPEKKPPKATEKRPEKQPGK